MNLNNLRNKAYKAACEHGFHDKQISDEHCLMLVITELSEAIEADRKACRANIDAFKRRFALTVDKPSTEAFKEAFEVFIKDTVEDELSDACIRLLSLAGLRGTDLSKCKKFEMLFSYIETDDEDPYSLTEAIFTTCKVITRGDAIDKTIRTALSRIIAICHMRGIDIEWHIEQKMMYNSFRERLHGKNY